jgi:hypothetical protein
MVIQGMENSLGDVHFIRRMHAKCENEAAIVLKRYIKFRNLKEIISSLSSKTSKTVPTLADMHVLLDEVALLLQYCCLYSKYLAQLCAGAESRVRGGGGGSGASSPRGRVRASSFGQSATGAHTPVQVQVLQAGSSQFHRMVEEVVNHMYMVGEQWVMEQGMKSIIPHSVDVSVEENNGLDECFFVLRRCGQRAIATNNIQVACALLQSISNLLSSNLNHQITEVINLAIEKLVDVAHEQCAKYAKVSGQPQQSSSIGGEAFSLGIKNAMNMATQFTVSTAGGAASGKDTTAAEDVVADKDDPFGLSNALQTFNIVEICVRYTERLTKEIHKTGSAVFAASYGSGTAHTPTSKHGVGGGTSDAERLQLACESLEGSKLSFQQVLKRAGDRLNSKLQPLLRDILQCAMGRNGQMGGVKFDMADDKFDAQPALVLLPRAVVAPVELLIAICTTSLSDNNKDMIIGHLADAVCERLEHFVTQVRCFFCFCNVLV